MINRKVGSGALAGALSIILVWVIKTFGGHELPAEVASGVTTVMTFVTSYFVTEPD